MTTLSDILASFNDTVKITRNGKTKYPVYYLNEMQCSMEDEELLDLPARIKNGKIYYNDDELNQWIVFASINQEV